jgi:hypothetical protein
MSAPSRLQPAQPRQIDFSFLYQPRQLADLVRQDAVGVLAKVSLGAQVAALILSDYRPAIRPEE